MLNTYVAKNVPSLAAARTLDPEGKGRLVDYVIVAEARWDIRPLARKKGLSRGNADLAYNNARLAGPEDVKVTKVVERLAQEPAIFAVPVDGDGKQIVRLGENDSWSMAKPVAVGA